jgi:hypothetical protein
MSAATEFACPTCASTCSGATSANGEKIYYDRATVLRQFGVFP